MLRVPNLPTPPRARNVDRAQGAAAIAPGVIIQPGPGAHHAAARCPVALLCHKQHHAGHAEDVGRSGVRLQRGEQVGFDAHGPAESGEVGIAERQCRSSPGLWERTALRVVCTRQPSRGPNMEDAAYPLWAVVIIGGPIALGLVLAFGVIRNRRRRRALARRDQTASRPSR